jgi:uncharacterized protein YcbK (DUF882 family)
MGDLSEHFSRKEFECSCGCGTDTVDAELLHVLESIRSVTGAAIKINSGHRCEKHNKSIGGAKNSMHLTGKAADIVVKGISPKDVYENLDIAYKDKYGIGKYETFTHIDVRKTKARW